MAARYVRIGQYPDYRDEVRGTLAEILASTANPGTYAAPEDVAGCTLEMGADGKWVGTLGSLSKATADALYTSGALASVAVGTPYRDTSGVSYSYQGAGVGWADAANKWDDDALLVIGDSRVVAEGGYEQYSGQTSMKGYTSHGIIAWAQAMLGDKRFRSVHLRGRSGMVAYLIAGNEKTNWNIQSLLASSNAKHVFVRIGTNDLNVSWLKTAEETISYISIIADAITSQGRIAHISTVEPRALINGYTTSNTIRGLKLNELIRDTFSRVANVYIVDIAQAFTDWASKANYLPDTGATTSVVDDGLHTSVRGAYVGGMVVKSHFEAFRKPSKVYGGFHYLSTKANSPNGTVQLLPGPLMDVGWVTFGGTGITYSTVLAPNGIGSALRVDVGNTASAGIKPLAYSDIQISAGDLVAGKELFAYARVRITGPNGAGAPIGLRAVSINAWIGNEGGPKNGTETFWSSDAGSYDPNGYTEFSGELLLVTPRYIMSGNDNINQPYLWIHARSVASSEYRIEIYDCGVILNNDPQGTKFAQFWTDSEEATPIY